VAEAVDRLRSADASLKAAWVVLVAGTLISAVAVLLFGQEVFFTVDEISWISASADFNLGNAFKPYVGHLVVIPKTIYWLVLETVGIRRYVLFQMMTIVSLFLMAALMFEWLRRRVPPFVALAPVLIVLIFPVDHLHYLTGNGITIALALAFGIAALIAWDRSTARGDLLALVLLILGLLTYTIAAPFAIGLLVAALISKQWGRVWVGLLPLLLYGIWRLVAFETEVEKLEGGPEWDNLLLLAAWSFQSLGAVLAALTGLGFDFSSVGGGPAVEQGRFLGPALATTSLLALGWWFWQGRRASTDFWLTGSILIALFASQVLVWGTIDFRDPGAPRYLLPGAVLLTLTTAALLRGVGWKRAPFIALWVVTASSLTISLGILVKSSDWLEDVKLSTRAEVTAINSVESSRKKPIAPALQPRQRVRPDFNFRKASRYGNLGLSDVEISSAPELVGVRIDKFIAESLRLSLTPVPPGTGLEGCRPAVKDKGAGFRPRVEISNPGAILKSSQDVSLSLGRYGSRPRVRLGVVPRGTAKKLYLPIDGDKKPWYLKADSGSAGTLADLEICAFK